jgi:hypothetical protein
MIRSPANTRILGTGRRTDAYRRSQFIRRDRRTIRADAPPGVTSGGEPPVERPQDTVRRRPSHAMSTTLLGSAGCAGGTGRLCRRELLQGISIEQTCGFRGDVPLTGIVAGGAAS